MASRSVRDVIQDQEVLSLPPTATVRTAAKAMTERNVGSVMVARGRRLLGIFTERDALSRVLAAGLDPDTTTLGRVMTNNVTAIGPDRELVHALHLMQDFGFRHVPVVEDDKLVGVVSIRDAMGSEIVRLEQEEQVKEELAETMR